MTRVWRSALLTAVATLLSSQGWAAPSVYTDDAAFLAAVSGIELDSLIEEGFESDSAWGDVRSSIAGGQSTAAFVTSQGLIWRSNNSTSGITTGSGAALSGSWGLYSLPHGSYTAPEPGTDCDIPGDCGDGLTLSTAGGTLYAAGGWFSTNTPVAKVGVFVGGYSWFGNQCNQEGVDCDAVSIGTSPQFLGVVDVDGFSEVEFRELEGKTEGPFGGDLKLVFSDDFTIAMNGAPRPVPSLSAPFLLLLAVAIGCIGVLRLRVGSRRAPG